MSHYGIRFKTKAHTSIVFVFYVLILFMPLSCIAMVAPPAAPTTIHNVDTVNQAGDYIRASERPTAGGAGTCHPWNSWAVFGWEEALTENARSDTMPRSEAGSIRDTLATLQGFGYHVMVFSGRGGGLLNVAQPILTTAAGVPAGAPIGFYSQLGADIDSALKSILLNRNLAAPAPVPHNIGGVDVPGAGGAALVALNVTYRVPRGVWMHADRLQNFDMHWVYLHRLHDPIPRIIFGDVLPVDIAKRIENNLPAGNSGAKGLVLETIVNSLAVPNRPRCVFVVDNSLNTLKDIHRNLQGIVPAPIVTLLKLR